MFFSSLGLVRSDFYFKATIHLSFEGVCCDCIVCAYEGVGEVCRLLGVSSSFFFFFLIIVLCIFYSCSSNLNNKMLIA